MTKSTEKETKVSSETGNCDVKSTMNSTVKPMNLEGIYKGQDGALIFLVVLVKRV